MQRIWEAHRLQPHRLRTFKKSNDPAFVEKVEDVVGLYMAPPCHAVVLSIDEKSQIQALDRTQPGLQLKPGKCATITYDRSEVADGLQRRLRLAENVRNGQIAGSDGCPLANVSLRSFQGSQHTGSGFLDARG